MTERNSTQPEERATGVLKPPREMKDFQFLRVEDRGWGPVAVMEKQFSDHSGEREALFDLNSLTVRRENLRRQDLWCPATEAAIAEIGAFQRRAEKARAQAAPADPALLPVACGISADDLTERFSRGESGEKAAEGVASWLNAEEPADER